MPIGAYMKRDQKIDAGDSLLKNMESKINDIAWKSRYEEFKPFHKSFKDIYILKEKLKNEYKTISKEVKELNELLNEEIANTAKLIKNIYKSTDEEFKDFFKTGKVIDVLGASLRNELMEVDYLIKGLSKYNNLNFSKEQITILTKKRNTLEEKINAMEDVEKKEDETTNSLKIAETEWNHLYKKIKNFLKNESKNNS